MSSTDTARQWPIGRRPARRTRQNAQSKFKRAKPYPQILSTLEKSATGPDTRRRPRAIISGCVCSHSRHTVLRELCNLYTRTELRKSMSKKDKKIKVLKKQLKELKAEVRKLKLASNRRKRNKVAKALEHLPKAQASTFTAVEKSPSISAQIPNISAQPRKVSARVVRQQ